MMTGVTASFSRRSRHMSNPFIFGSIRSSRIRSGAAESARSSPDSPSYASTVSKPVFLQVEAQNVYDLFLILYDQDLSVRHKTVPSTRRTRITAKQRLPFSAVSPAPYGAARAMPSVSCFKPVCAGIPSPSAQRPPVFTSRIRPCMTSSTSASSATCCVWDKFALVRAGLARKEVKRQIVVDQLVAKAGC